MLVCEQCEKPTIYRCGCGLTHCSECNGPKGECGWYREVGSTRNRTGVRDVPPLVKDGKVTGFTTNRNGKLKSTIWKTAQGKTVKVKHKNNKPKTKKKSGCLGCSVVAFVPLGAVGWGIYETVSAIL